MDIIKKRINLETYKNHTPAFFPYIKVYNDGKWHDKNSTTTDAVVIPTGGATNSWGNVLCDMPDLSGTTAALLSKYYEINSILKTGIKMKRMVSDGGVIIYVDTFEDKVKSYDYQVSNIDFLNAIKPHAYKLVTGDTQGDFVVFLSHESYERYLEIGGEGFISYVEENILGLIKVEFSPGSLYYGQEIEGILVPEKFYISAIQKWLNWFDENIPGKDDECNCFESEWEKRGGDKMRSFLEENEYRVSKFKQKPQVSAPVLSIPVFLSHNYDDNGIMSVYDEDTPYDKSKDTGRTAYETDYYSKPYEPDEGINTESKLESLRSNVKMYDDSGNLLPFIDTEARIISGENITYGYLPYRMEEGFNISYDVDSGEYVADYIVGEEDDVVGIKMTAYTSDGIPIELNKEIPLKKNGEVIKKEDNITGITVDFTYVIGGVYSQNKENISIRNNIDSVPSRDGTYNNAITITAKKPWVILSNNSLFSVSPSSDGAGTYNLSLSVNDKNTSITDDRQLTVVAATTGKIHDEVMCTIIQEHSTPPATCSFDGSLPTTISFGSDTTKRITVRCNGSGWYLRSKPSFMDVDPTSGKDGVSTSVKLTCQLLPSGTNMREGILEFVATDNQNVTYKPTVTQGTNIPTSFIATIDGGSTIEYGETKAVYGYTSSGRFNIDESWGYRIIDTLYSNDIFVSYTQESGMTFTNRSTRTDMINVRVEIYNKEMPSVSSIVTATLIGDITISIIPSGAIALDAWGDRVFTVSVNGDNSDNWEPYVTGDGAEKVKVAKITYNTFRVTNDNDDEMDLVALVGAKSTTRENIKSNEVSVTVRPKPKITIKCCIVQENYPCPVDVDIWPCCEGEDADETKIANFACDGCPTVIDELEACEDGIVIRDRNNRYYVRFNQPLSPCGVDKGYVDAYDYEGGIPYRTPGTMKYFIINEYDLTQYLVGDMIYIKFVIRGSR